MREAGELTRLKKHQDFSGKYCPHRTLDMGWIRFLNMIQAELDKINKDSVKVNIKGKIHYFEGVFDKDKNYVGVRDLAEALGYKVDWDNANKVVIIK